MLKWVLVFALATFADETIIVKQAPPTYSEQFNQTMRDLNSSLDEIGRANRENEALGIQQANHELEAKRFELDVLDRAIRFEKDYPGEPNPYRAFLASMRAPAKPAPVVRPGFDGSGLVMLGVMGVVFVGIGIAAIASH